MNNHYLSSLAEELIRNAYNSGKFTTIQEIYRACDWRIAIDEKNYSIPSIYNIEAKVRELCELMANSGTDYEEFQGIYVKLEYTTDERAILSFGFNYRADTVYEKQLHDNNVKIIDENGNNVDIVAVDIIDNITTIQIKSKDNFKFQKDLMQKYKNEFKNKLFGDYHD